MNNRNRMKMQKSVIFVKIIKFEETYTKDLKKFEIIATIQVKIEVLHIKYVI